jgi:hypothetical protein
VPRRFALLFVLAPALGIGATALAQGGGNQRLRIDMQRGCLTGTRVTVRLVPPAGEALSPVRLRADGQEFVHLTGVTQAASVTMRLGHRRGRVTVDGETTGGRRFVVMRDYRPCVPGPPRSVGPEPTLSGGGEG